MKPQVSVIMSIHGDEPYLEEAIESILSQTYKQFELIIVDDKAATKAHNSLRKYEKIRNVTVIRNREHKGLASSLNKAIVVAKGKYIARMDADDISHPTRLSKQVNFMEQNPNVTLLGTGINMMDEKQNIIKKVHGIGNINQLSLRLKKKNCLAHPTIMWRASASLKYRDKFTYAQDYDLYLRLLSQKQKIACLEEILLNYRVRTTSISFSKSELQKTYSLIALQMFNQRNNDGRDDYNKLNEQYAHKLAKREPFKQQIFKSKIKQHIALNQSRELVDDYRKYYRLYGFDKMALALLWGILPSAIRQATIKISPSRLLRWLNE